MKTETNPLKDSLISLGLSDKEASVYLALLELGRSAVSKVARKAGVNRATGYVILDSLVNKGLAQISGKEPKQEYAAESPDNLPALFRKQREEADARIEKSESLALQLKSVQKQETRPQVKFYEGVEGMRQVYEDTLTSREMIRVYAPVERAHATMPNYFPKYYQRRAEKGIHIKGITPRTPMAIERIPHNAEEKREMVMVPPDRFSISPEIDIYDNKLMITSWQEKLGIIIESAEIADAMKKLFELAWIGAKQIEQKD